MLAISFDFMIFYFIICEEIVCNTMLYRIFSMAENRFYSNGYWSVSKPKSGKSVSEYKKNHCVFITTEKIHKKKKKKSANYKMVLKALGRVFKKIVFTGTLVGGILLFFLVYSYQFILYYMPLEASRGHLRWWGIEFETNPFFFFLGGGVGTLPKNSYKPS